MIKIVATMQKSYYKAKMYQIRFRLGLRPIPCWVVHGAPADLLDLLGLRGPTSKGKKARERRKKMMGKMEGKKRKKKKWKKGRGERGKKDITPDLAEAIDPPLGGNLEVRTGRPMGLLSHCSAEYTSVTDTQTDRPRNSTLCHNSGHC